MIFNFKLIAKASLIWIIISLAIFLPGYLDMTLTKGDLGIYGMFGSFLNLIQGIIMGVCGYWLCQKAYPDNELAPAVYDTRMRQFVSKYGMIALVMFLILYILRDSSWPFRDAALCQTENGTLIIRPEGNIIKHFIDRCLSLSSIISLYIMYLSFGWAKSWRQVQLKRRLVTDLKTSPMVGYLFIPVVAIVMEWLFS